jgi:hypothetical protein
MHRRSGCSVDPAPQRESAGKRQGVHFTAFDHAEFEVRPKGALDMGSQSLICLYRAKDAINAARSAASARVNDISGIFGCGSSRKSAIRDALKPGRKRRRLIVARAALGRGDDMAGLALPVRKPRAIVGICAPCRFCTKRKGQREASCSQFGLED